jgi:cysteinyl-tRNA synthetase
MKLYLYNTLTRRKDEFVPLDGRTVRMYSCGPTVYNYAHIGNMRTYVFTDLLRRTLRYAGYKLKGVMNITDVGHLTDDGDNGEDKMEVAAKERKQSPYEIAETITKAFFSDLALINVGRTELTPKATDHIAEMIEFVVKLEEKGYAYPTDDGIYFDISKFGGYGKLSGARLDENIAGARVEVNAQKRNPADFALWKHASPNHIMQWDSPWGRGFPGWHIECSAMSRKYLGNLFDIHTGGIDHIPIHHENEIAQSEALEGKPTVRFWIHSGFMNYDGGKMSKSLGNTYRVTDLADRGYAPLSFRFFCLNAHYRNSLNFTFEGLTAAEKAYKRLLAMVYQHKIGTESADDAALAAWQQRFEDAIGDDLNIPLAVGNLFTLLKDLPKSKKVFDLVCKMDGVLGLSLKDAAAPETEPRREIPQEITALAEARLAAKKAKDFAKSDALRAEIAEKGYTVIDVPGGYKIS